MGGVALIDVGVGLVDGGVGGLVGGGAGGLGVGALIDVGVGSLVDFGVDVASALARKIKR